jgi:hypothetical protein
MRGGPLAESAQSIQWGLFAHDDDLGKLYVPNSVFCQHMQGANEASLYSFRKRCSIFARPTITLPTLAAQTARDHLSAIRRRASGFTHSGVIFEQSITELEILEAEADDRPSINKESKRKRDGVYYTPEWVVERVVDEPSDRGLPRSRRSAGGRPKVTLRSKPSIRIRRA